VYCIQFSDIKSIHCFIKNTVIDWGFLFLLKTQIIDATTIIMKTTYRTVKPPSDRFHCRPPCAIFCLLPTEQTEKVNANILILSWSDEKDHSV
jgi:hypothetical protein